MYGTLLAEKLTNAIQNVKILTQEQINIDYDTNGRKLNHQLVTGEWNNEILD
jgi:hypothetical protein